jgi:hypothetical protein
VAAELKDEQRKRSGVFGRYAQVVDNIDNDEAKPVSVLLDFNKDGFVDIQDETTTAMNANPELDYDDLCSDGADNGDFIIKIAGVDIPCSIEYRPEVKKYRLNSDALNERYPANVTQDRRQKQTLVQRLNQEQSFKVIVERNGVVYSEGRFYKPRLRWLTENGLKPATGCLAAVISEKGERLYDADRSGWYRTSIFGLFSAVCDEKLAASGVIEDELTRDALSHELDVATPANRVKQLLMHWDAMQTGCARASVRLRLFCD